jgi:hypothetical protein
VLGRAWFFFVRAINKVDKMLGRPLVGLPHSWP